MHKKLKVLRSYGIKQKKTIKRLQTKLQRQNKKICSLKEVIETLESRNLLSENEILSMFGSTGPSTGLLQQQLYKMKTGRKCKQFSQEVRVFAMNLHFYSPKAYEYVRTSLGMCLPSRRTISTWYRSVDGSPGFTTESLNILKLASNEAFKSNEQLYVVLMFDEMSIRQKIELINGVTYGVVDMGELSNSDELASNMFVMMAVCINKHWKLPVGYFSVTSLKGDQKKQVLCMGTENIIECGALVVGWTFDGIYSNITCARLLGCELNNVDRLVTTFELTNNKFKNKICLFLDPVHMLKLMRNLFDYFKVFYDQDGNKIDYGYVVKLCELQENEGLHLANKLSRAHIYFHKKIMNVRLAAQLLSDSVADALEFCLNVLNLEEFVGCEGTIKFIRYCNKIFDVLNSRMIKEKNPQKRPLCSTNYEQIKIFTEDAIIYLKGI